MAILGLLAAVAAPQLMGVVTRAEEAALRENLSVMRRALDDHFADTGGYPEDLATLVERRYIRFVPDDPVAPEDAGWDVVAHDEGGVADIRSTSDEPGTDGRPYSEW
jgi:type II secretory pathway pseudopilin PulG